MKNAFLVSIITILLFSCSGDPSPVDSNNSLDLRNKYVDQAKNYFEDLVFYEKNNDEIEIKLKRVSNIRIKTTIPLTKRELEASRINLSKLNRDVRVDRSHDLINIDQNVSDGMLSAEEISLRNQLKEYNDSLNFWAMTEEEQEEIKKFNDSISHWRSTLNQLDDRARIGFAVHYTVDFELSNGVKLKNSSFILHFDDKYKLKKAWNLPTI